MILEDRGSVIEGDKETDGEKEINCTSSPTYSDDFEVKIKRDREINEIDKDRDTEIYYRIERE